MNREKCCALCQSITCKTLKKIKKNFKNEKKKLNKKKKTSLWRLTMPLTIGFSLVRPRLGAVTRLRPSGRWVIYLSLKVNEVRTFRVQTFRSEWHHNRFSLHTVQCWHNPDAFVFLFFVFLFVLAGNFTNTVKVATGPPLSLRWPPLFLGFFFFFLTQYALFQAHIQLLLQLMSLCSSQLQLYIFLVL